MKTVAILRSPSGGGKSTLARNLAFNNANSVILSTDEFFVKNGEYRFDSSKLKMAHKWNHKRFENEVRQSRSYIIIDNTNITYHESDFYANLGLDNGYLIKFIEPGTPWQFNVDELVKRNVHRVPRESIQRMVDRWQTTEDILKIYAGYPNNVVDFTERTVQAS